MGNGFMGSLRGKNRTLECGLRKNRGGKFVEVNLIVLNRRQKVCIPESEGCDGWSTFASRLVDFELCWRERFDSQREPSSMQNAIASSNIYDDDRLMGFLGRICLDQIGASRVPIEELKTICEWIDQICGGRSKSTKAIEGKAVEQFVRGKSNNGGAEKLAAREALQREKRVGIPKVSDNALEISEHRVMGGLGSRGFIEANKNHFSREYCITGGRRCNFQNQNSSGAFIRGEGLDHSGYKWSNNNTGNRYSIFHARNKLLMGSKVMGHEKYVWVPKQKLIGGKKFQGQNGNSKGESSSTSSIEMRVAAMGENWSVGQNSCIAVSKSFGTTDRDAKLFQEEVTIEKLEGDASEHKRSNQEIVSESDKEIGRQSLIGGVEQDKEHKGSNQEKVSESDKEIGRQSLIGGVEHDKELEKVSQAMHLKRLRAKKPLKGRFWFSNRLEFFRAQRRCGSIRIKKLIFGA